MRVLKYGAIAVSALLVVGVLSVAWLRVPKPMPVADAATVIVYSPHPDDETYAMGQAVATQALAGKRVIGVLITDGENSGQVPAWILDGGRDVDADGDVDRWDFGLARREEYAAAMEALGASEVVYLGAASSQGLSGFRDGQLATDTIGPDLRAVADGVDGEVEHFTLMKYLPEHRFVGDARLHTDHSEVCEVVSDLAAERGERSLFFKVYVMYHTQWWKQWSPLVVRGSAEALERKRNAVECYRSIGAASTRELWDAARRTDVEYAVPPALF